MKIEKNLLDNISLLAALKLDEQEKDAFLKYLKETLSYFEKIKDIKTDQVPPLTTPFDVKLRLREDEVVDFDAKTKLLEQVPEKQGNLVKVPPVV
ncbi:MAG: Asp-tRNA(Asn)/Glu-tRNA(Gln) amidotransferase subunit GatC [Bdellovibrionales bacterium]